MKVFPTWVIGTERREGVQSLSALADPLQVPYGGGEAHREPSPLRGEAG